MFVLSSSSSPRFLGGGEQHRDARAEDGKEDEGDHNGGRAQELLFLVPAPAGDAGAVVAVEVVTLVASIVRGRLAGGAQGPRVALAAVVLPKVAEVPPARTALGQRALVLQHLRLHLIL